VPVTDSGYCRGVADYFQRAALAGSLDALVNLGEIFTRGIGIQPDEEKGMMYFEVTSDA
jgi:TPR repeat protein